MIVKNLNYSIGTQTIFKNCNFIVEDNSKVGVIGVNGAGKTTFFNLIVGNLQPNSGEILLKKTDRIGYLPQTIDFSVEDPHVTAYDYICEGRPIKALEECLQDIEHKLEKATEEHEVKKLLNEYSHLTTQLDYWDRYEATMILDKILDGMHLTEETLLVELKNISGGEKSKVAFARLLYSKPSILLLDEPTNHLDKESREWVIGYLQKYKGQALVVSHDYQFLDAIADKILYIDQKTSSISLFQGNYTKFLKTYEELKLTNERIVKQQEAEEKRLVSIIKSFEGVSGKRKKMAFNKGKALERLRANKVEAIRDDRVAQIKLKANPDQNKVPLQIKNLYFSYGKECLLQNIDLSMGSKERLLIAGNNGVGKSTMLKLIVGELTPQSGSITIGNKTKIAYYDQEQKEINSTDQTIIDYFLTSGYSQRQARDMLSKYLFRGDKLETPIKRLSPGEKCRLSFARLSLLDSNLMILDEPTNHLDALTQKVIAQNLNEYDGAILLVSHNPEFVESLNIDRMLLLPQGRCINYDRAKLLQIQQFNESDYEKF